MIQELVARSVGAELGKYVHLVGSLHLYDRNAASATKFLAEGWQGSSEMPEMPVGDPWDEVDRLIELESVLRTTSGSKPPDEILDTPYWGDLAAMLWAFRASLDGEPHLDEVAACLTKDYYKVYMDDRQVKVEGR
jgi:thymidylate synthase